MCDGGRGSKGDVGEGGREMMWRIPGEGEQEAEVGESQEYLMFVPTYPPVGRYKGQYTLAAST